MRRLTAIALVAAGLALPAWGQRGMARGGFSGHSASSFHGGFSAPQFSGSLNAPRAYGFNSSPGFQARSFGTSPFTARSFSEQTRSGFRVPYFGAPHGNDGHHTHYSYSYSYSVYTAPRYYAYPGWVGLGPLGYYPGDFGSDDSVSSAGDSGSGGQDYEAQSAQSPEPEQPAFREDYAPQAAPPPPPPDVPLDEEATTLVFKDGRSEQVHNYALTRTTLFVLDQTKRDIPVAQLDLAATEKVNRAAGIEFQIPKLPE